MLGTYLACAREIVEIVRVGAVIPPRNSSKNDFSHVRNGMLGKITRIGILMNFSMK